MTSQTSNHVKFGNIFDSHEAEDLTNSNVPTGSVSRRRHSNHEDDRFIVDRDDVAASRATETATLSTASAEAKDVLRPSSVFPPVWSYQGRTSTWRARSPTLTNRSSRTNFTKQPPDKLTKFAVNRSLAAMRAPQPHRLRSKPLRSLAQDTTSMSDLASTASEIWSDTVQNETKPATMEPRETRSNPNGSTARPSRNTSITTTSVVETASAPPSEAPSVVIAEPEPLEQGWIILEQQRDVASAAYDSVHKTRRALDKATNNVLDTVRKVMDLLRPPQGSEPRLHIVIKAADIDLLYELLQTQHKEVLDLEDIRADVEQGLERAQRELNLVERSYIGDLLEAKKRLNPADDSAVSPERIAEPQPTTPDPQGDLLGMRDWPVEDVQPAYTKLMSTIARYRLLTEELEELKYSRQNAEDDEHLLELQEGLLNVSSTKQRRAHVDNRTLLEEFDSRQSRYREELASLQAQIDELNKICETQHVIPRFRPVSEIKSLNPDFSDDDYSIESDSDVDEDSERPSLLYCSRFPILLSDPVHCILEPPLTSRSALKQAINLPADDPSRQARIDAAAKEYTIDNLAQHVDKGGSKTDLINRWLFQRLRISPHEVEHLFAISSEELVITDLMLWQQEVLYYWAKDESAQTPGSVIEDPIASEEIPSNGTIPDDQASSLPTELLE